MVKIVVTIVILTFIITTVADVNYIYKAVIYNFADIDDHKIFNNRTIPATNPMPLPVSQSLNKIALPEKLKTELEELNTVAFLVVKQDAIVQEHYWGGYSDTSLSSSFSIAKSIISILTGIAVNEGYIKSLNDPVGNYIETYNSEGKEKIIIKHLLTMTSGLNWVESYILPVTHTAEAYYGKDLRKLIDKLEVV